MRCKNCGNKLDQEPSSRDINENQSGGTAMMGSETGTYLCENCKVLTEDHLTVSIDAGEVQANCSMEGCQYYHPRFEELPIDEDVYACIRGVEADSAIISARIVAERTRYAGPRHLPLRVFSSTYLPQ